MSYLDQDDLPENQSKYTELLKDLITSPGCLPSTSQTQKRVELAKKIEDEEFLSKYIIANPAELSQQVKKAAVEQIEDKEVIRDLLVNYNVGKIDIKFRLFKKLDLDDTECKNFVVDHAEKLDEDILVEMIRSIRSSSVYSELSLVNTKLRRIIKSKIIR